MELRGALTISRSICIFIAFVCRWLVDPVLLVELKHGSGSRDSLATHEVMAPFSSGDVGLPFVSGMLESNPIGSFR